MKKERQLILIARFEGWTDCELYYPSYEFPEENPPPFVRGHKTKDSLWMQLPDYLNDLDAIHEAEMKIGQGFLSYCYVLSAVVDGISAKNVKSLGPHECANCAFATAAQRSEALLKTLGLWEKK